MKICAIICEFNPFHNGHKYILEQARKLSGCDKLLCIMSANFTQRGEICIQNKFTRAKHAILGGSDAVLELPAAFSVAPAEIFAKGAVKILSSIPQVTKLAFGCENDNKQEFLNSANILINENNNFKTTLKNGLEAGESYIKSYRNAFFQAGGNVEFIDNPNNILGIEYTKSVIKYAPKIEILPIKRVGAGFCDGKLYENFSSASAIRNNLLNENLKNNVPHFVYKDLQKTKNNQLKYQEFARLILSRSDAAILADTYGCTEGLENSLKNNQSFEFSQIIAHTSGKRYTSSRIARIICANFLNLRKSKCEQFLNSKLYLKPIAVKKEAKEEILSVLAKAEFPLIISGKDKLSLNSAAYECLALDDFAYAQWLMISSENNGKKPQNGLITV